ncbi:MAG: choice-of-anchor D domain-containing protein [Solirubrobacteraceae bacterium]
MYRALITQIVSHADPVISDWEIWNEPDTPQSFSGTPEQYAQMLRAAHNAIKQVDPFDDVLLGGISSTAGMGWLEQVFATPGADAAQAFDIANVHVRAPLDSVAPDIEWWKVLFANYGFNGPLWVTEHSYPSDPGYQYDPAYTDGTSSQASYLTASIPSMLDAGANKVFVTERDNLDGAFASEGLLGGEVSDPPVAHPDFFEKPSYAAVWSLAECYAALARDCPGPAPTATPASVTFPATAPGNVTSLEVSVTDPGAGPLKLGRPTIAGVQTTLLGVHHSGCTGELLEPAQTCTFWVRFAPTRGGNVAGVVRLPSDNGPLIVPAHAVAPSVSSLASPQLAHPRFEPMARRGGAGPQELSLVLTNPLPVPVSVAGARVSGGDARRFEITSDRCARFRLGPRARCQLVVRFSPARPGRARAALVVTGEGRPLSLALRPFARMASPSHP